MVTLEEFYKSCLEENSKGFVGTRVCHKFSCGSNVCPIFSECLAHSYSIKDTHLFSARIKSVNKFVLEHLKIKINLQQW